MLSPSNLQPPDLNRQGNLVAMVNAVVPGAGDCCPELPPIPTRFLGRKDLSRIFNRHQDTVHRWEQDGWLCAIRKPSNRVGGYPAEQVAVVAARLHSHFPNFAINQIEAERLGYLPLLSWVAHTVRTSKSYGEAKKEPLFDLLDLAALADAHHLVSELGITLAELAEHRAAARGRLLSRLNDLFARHLLLNGWRQSGIAARVRATSKT